MKNKLRISFAGSAEFAKQHLHCLIKSNKFYIVSVYTKPDKPAGRGKKKGDNPVKKLALESGLAVFQPHILDSDIIDQVAEHKLDALIVVSYGMKIPARLLNIPKYGCLNVHASLLPKYRGASPIQSAILANDNYTGVSIMRMDENIDTGPVLLQARCDIATTDTSASLFLKLADLGATSLLDTLERINNIPLQAQNDAQSSSCKQIAKQDGKIDWGDDASLIERKIRAYNPWPIAFTYCGSEQLRIWQAAVHTYQGDVGDKVGDIVLIKQDHILIRCGSSVPSYLAIYAVQFPGKKVLPLKQLLNAYKTFFISNSTLV